MGAVGFIRRHARFGRASVAGGAITLAEMGLLAVLTHGLGLEHALAYAAVQVLATVGSFLANKYWAFHAGAGSVKAQGFKYVLVFLGSFVLNTALPSVGSYILHREPVSAFAVSQLLVWSCWNYPLNRYWVFRQPRPQAPPHSP